MPANPWMPIGQVVGAHGINGAVKVHFYDDRPRDLTSGGTLHLRLDDGTRTGYSVEWARPHKRNYLLGLAGVYDRDQAQALKDARVVIQRSEMPDLEDDLFEDAALYQQMLRGLLRRPRQIIWSTVNPNIPVAWDADHILVCGRRRDDRRMRVVASGAIDRPRVRKYALDILEGGEDALRKRSTQYGV